MGTLSKRKRARTTRATRGNPVIRAPRTGTAVVWPKGVQERYGISAPTRWRWEKAKRLPPRDVYVGGVPIGWKPETLRAAERGPATAPAA
jgi:predicted DNA-binding transcriptional regulator AlpA